MKKILFLTAALVLGATALRAQNPAATNEGMVDFLEINPDARTAAMANATTATSGGANSIFGNAAAMLFTAPTWELSLNYAPWASDVRKGTNMFSLGAYYKIKYRHSVALGVRYMMEPKFALDGDYPYIPDNAEFDLLMGKRPAHFDVDVAYAYRINQWIAVSLTARYASSMNRTLNDDATAIAKQSAVGFDVAAYSRFGLDAMMDGASVSAGLKVADIGFSMGDYKDQYKLPMRASIGGSLYTPFVPGRHTLETSLDLGYRFAPSDAASFGAGLGLEYGFNELLYVRGGYHMADSKGYNYGTLGLGVHVWKMNLSGSFLLASKDCPWRNTWQLSLGVAF